MRVAAARVARDPLAELRALVAAHEARLTALEARRQRPDPARDGALLAAIAHVRGERYFSASILLADSDPELRAALAGHDARSLGAWLKRVRRHPVPPYRLEPIKRSNAGLLWTLCISAQTYTA